MFKLCLLFLTATMLLDNLIAHLTSGVEKNSNTCKAIYLHVLTTNGSAIQFYERRMFRRHNYLPLYYSVKGVGKDGFSYVLYINGGCPPFSVIYPFQAAFKFILDIFSWIWNTNPKAQTSVNPY